MQKTGLIGRTLSHSMSPQIHDRFYKLTGTKGRYTLLETEPEALGDLVGRCEADGFTGVNVTIPYKTDIIAHIDRLASEAAAIGAVNTVLFSDGERVGHNTDYFGLKTLLGTNDIALAGKTVAVLGTGGAARCALALAKDEGAVSVLAVSRHPQNADGSLAAVGYAALESLASIDVLINATPVGMSPNTDACPVSDAIVQKCAAVVDMVYNPEVTQLLHKAASHGCKAVGGLMMLVAQAIKAQEIWTGKAYDHAVYDDVMAFMHRSIYRQKRNIVIVGMPGSGKSAVGKALSKRLSMPFADTDAMVEQFHGSIPDIFAQQGEAAFRAMEHEAAKQAAEMNGAVISTGGGMVLDARNMHALKETGTIVYINRPLSDLLEDIDISGRPLLAKGKHKLTGLFEVRSPLYNEYADIVAHNTADIQACVDDIAKQWEEQI